MNVPKFKSHGCTFLLEVNQNYLQRCRLLLPNYQLLTKPPPPPHPPNNERPKTRASECRQRAAIVRADADPAARERDLRGVEAAGGQQFGADDGADEGAVCEEEYVDYICATTGFGGQPIKSAAHNTDDPSKSLRPVVGAKRIRVTFNGSVSDVLPWSFTPQQREVRVLPGETALAFYTATNKSSEDIIGVATYSVTPGQVAPHFSKIQCFCFEEQRLNAGETVDMPVFFYIDPEFVNDPNMKGIEQVTLSYTFFKARYGKNGQLSPLAVT
ncbi:hypothetical protein V501_10412 [Pseudogymnoascus sp. VKM F-4519 (FW-2642)]|nr:hypothetical protein V501_10412 [Pseudogymnoascus sp. VKM F-4519 (FW-2642)]